MSLQLCEAGKVNWVFFVKNMLYTYGFGFAFLNQGVGNEKQFMSLFKQRVKDNHLQEWYSSVNEMSKLECYSKFKNMFEMEKYLSVIDIKNIELL